ncbi:RHS repeat domain-containing protein, partial [Leptospira sp. GIMC2001]|uniref:RHS repeat domain-containing protein n=1 Tax=Leptospira sp. GIMC2001 TaxID=1513297 RepID=UPI00234A9660
ERHTLFISGISGDLVSQYTRPDANLLNEVAINDSLSEQNEQDLAYIMMVGYNEVKRDLTLVLDGIPTVSILRAGYTVVAPVKLFLWIGLMLLVIYIAINISSEIKVISRFASALALVPFLFINIYSCSPLFYGGASGEEGVPPWLLGLGIPADTQGVNSPTTTSGGGGGGSASQETARIPGMFFMHPDHLGSITMLTDGYGNVLAGGEMGGKSHITYKPYGEILRTDSYGPDVSKYKYTGQEEDMESGLYYYKARYYDPAMGRFMQNDTEVNALEPNGMNRMMYVSGDPISFRDPSGNICGANVFSALALVFLGPVIGSFVAAGGGVSGNHTGGGSCSKLPNEKHALGFLIFFRAQTIADPGEKNALLYMGMMYIEGLTGKGPSPLGKMSRTELQLFLLLEQNTTNLNPAIYFAIYSMMTTGVLNPKTAIDTASMHHDHFGPKILDPNNRRANSQWMGRAKTAAFSHDSWSSNYKREYEAAGHCGRARAGCATINSIGTTIGNAVTAAVGSITFSIANGLTGLGTIRESRYYIRKARGKIKL